MSKKKSPKKSAPKAKPAAGRGPMSVDLLEEIVGLMAANDLNTVDIRDGDRRIILKRGPAAPVVVAGGVIQPATSAPAAQMLAPAGNLAAAKLPPDEDAGLKPIKSPMVGTFYSAASPDAKPFVTVGSQVVKDDTDVCVIEAMKVFNNIKSEVTGAIAKIMVENGQTVEFGQTLFLVKA